MKGMTQMNIFFPEFYSSISGWIIHWAISFQIQSKENLRQVLGIHLKR